MVLSKSSKGYFKKVSKRALLVALLALLPASAFADSSTLETLGGLGFDESELLSGATTDGQEPAFCSAWRIIGGTQLCALSDESFVGGIAIVCTYVCVSPGITPRFEIKRQVHFVRER
ncbi:MAG: hypothetical protein KDD44_05630 [Bdellovibrionales bacterium]|nr:hypothetical protein [Bdellovibrionales bacterium]